MKIVDQNHGRSVNEGHLGGWCFDGDGGTYYPLMWEYLQQVKQVEYVLDIGAGRGFSSLFFKDLGCDVVSLDGSPTAKAETLVPDNFVLCDYTLGSSGLTRKFDLAWSCEFVEHVEEKYAVNYMKDFCLCKHVAMTFASPGQGGHHHVNENTEEYWIGVFEKNGFEYDREFTLKLRNKAREDAEFRQKIPGVKFFIPHFAHRGLFFTKKY